MPEQSTPLLGSHSRVPWGDESMKLGSHMIRSSLFEGEKGVNFLVSICLFSVLLPNSTMWVTFNLSCNVRLIQ